MIWQDVAMMAAGFAFAPALFVSIIKKKSYPLGTTIPTAIALTVLTVCVATLGLKLAAIADGLTAIFWYILIFRR